METVKRLGLKEFNVLTKNIKIIAEMENPDPDKKKEVNTSKSDGVTSAEVEAIFGKPKKKINPSHKRK